MKKFLFIFAVFACIVPSLGYAAVNVKVKKAAPVATKKADTMESATSLLPAVLNLVSSVKALNMQQQQLSADCAPTSDEINTVNNLVKEWAKIGDTSAQSACYGLGQFVCNGGYAAHVRDFDEGEACYETFEDLADRETIWQGFPKVSSAQKCDVDGKKCHTVSNIYDIFAKIPFSDDDYTQAEAKKVGALKEKANRCAPAKIKAAKRELYGGFLVQTLNSVGQTTAASGTSSIIEAVSSMGGSGDLKSMLPSLGQMALQGFDK